MVLHFIVNHSIQLGLATCWLSTWKQISNQLINGLYYNKLSVIKFNKCKSPCVWGKNAKLVLLANLWTWLKWAHKSEHRELANHNKSYHAITPLKHSDFWSLSRFFNTIENEKTWSLDNLQPWQLWWLPLILITFLMTIKTTSANGKSQQHNLHLGS